MRRRDVLKGTAVAGVGLFGPHSPARPFRVHVVAFDGVEEMDYTAPYEVFGWAKLLGGNVELTLVTEGAPATVRAMHGTSIVVRAGWSPRTADLIVVPGGEIDPVIERGTLPAALAAARRPGLTLASVCLGALILSAGGITKGRPCTTHHLGKEKLAAEGGRLVDARVVDDGDVVTSGGITSGLDLALWLIRRQFGPDLTLRVERMLEYDRRGTVWQRS